MNSNSSGLGRGRAGGREIALTLRRLADRTQQANRSDEFKILSEGLAPICDGLAYIGSPPSFGLHKLATRQLLEGAFESAILNLVPVSATVTCERIGRLQINAQVKLANHPGHYARNAPTLALAWFSALTHSLADLIEQSPP